MQFCVSRSTGVWSWPWEAEKEIQGFAPVGTLLLNPAVIVFVGHCTRASTTEAPVFCHNVPPLIIQEDLFLASQVCPHLHPKQSSSFCDCRIKLQFLLQINCSNSQFPCLRVKQIIWCVSFFLLQRKKRLKKKSIFTQKCDKSLQTSLLFGVKIYRSERSKSLGKVQNLNLDLIFAIDFYHLHFWQHIK